VIEKGTWWQSPSGHNRVEIRGHLGVSTLLVWNEKDMAEKYMQAELLDDWVQVPPPLPTGEVRITDPKTGGQKGQKLAQLGALDPLSLLELAKVAGFGAQKYDRFNFLRGYSWSLSFDAFQRHALAFWNGEDRDPESGLPHMSHCAWHALTMLAFYLRGLGTDDRFKQPMPGAQPE
jgi:hypothetical protein